MEQGDLVSALIAAAATGHAPGHAEDQSVGVGRPISPLALLSPLELQSGDLGSGSSSWALSQQQQQLQLQQLQLQQLQQQQQRLQEQRLQEHQLLQQQALAAAHLQQQQQADALYEAALAAQSQAQMYQQQLQLQQQQQLQMQQQQQLRNQQMQQQAWLAGNAVPLSYPGAYATQQMNPLQPVAVGGARPVAVSGLLTSRPTTVRSSASSAHQANMNSALAFARSPGGVYDNVGVLPLGASGSAQAATSRPRLGSLQPVHLQDGSVQLQLGSVQQQQQEPLHDLQQQLLQLQISQLLQQQQQQQQQEHQAHAQLRQHQQHQHLQRAAASSVAQVLSARRPQDLPSGISVVTLGAGARLGPGRSGTLPGVGGGQLSPPMTGMPWPGVTAVQLSGTHGQVWGPGGGAASGAVSASAVSAMSGHAAGDSSCTERADEGDLLLAAAGAGGTGGGDAGSDAGSGPEWEADYISPNHPWQVRAR
jgi:hypothetical protein